MERSLDNRRVTAPVLVVVSALTLSGCATAMVTSAVVGTAATATKVAVKGTVGATKLAYRGTKAVVKGTSNLVTGGTSQPH
ncbi:MAG: hypothetical protein OXR62_00120 [Ahrensia sp.]|nr:hypothetical protein [Ahrensia sp.]